MKKYVFIFIALIAMSQHVCAQGMTATLQSGDSLTVFYGADAFSAAYFYANDGDQITLSAGNFNVPQSNITKSVKITGVGSCGPSYTSMESLTLTGNDIRVEGIEVTKRLNISCSANLILKRCLVGVLEATSAFYDALFDETVFISFIKGFEYSNGFTFKNCTIKTFSGTTNANDVGLVTNCVIYSSGRLPYAIYKNNLLGYSSTSSSAVIRCEAPSEFYNNVAFSTSSYSVRFNFVTGCLNNDNVVKPYSQVLDGTESYPAVPKDVPDGDDGTPVGPFGGSGFSLLPSIPYIVSSTIDNSTNDEGKINVKITVGVEP